MKKIKLFVVSCAAFLTTIGANAQSFTTDKDTTKGYWTSGAGNIDIHIKAINSAGISNIQVNWKFIDFHLDPKWAFVSICDNLGCFSGSVGLYDGSITHTSDNIAPSAYGDFKVSFNGDSAANNTKSYVTVELSNGSYTKPATFVAYKNPAGIVTSFLQDNDIAIFPNPAQNYIDVVYSPASDVKTIALYNLIGKVVSVYKTTSKNSARCEFNTDMPSGIYVVRIADSKGNVIATRKITRQ
jgi:hypothetical protein